MRLDVATNGDTAHKNAYATSQAPISHQALGCESDNRVCAAADRNVGAAGRRALGGKCHLPPTRQFSKQKCALGVSPARFASFATLTSL